MLKVIKQGIYTTIQDLGRKGFAQFGVPISGAMDLYSATLANNLLGNDPNSAVIEITYGNATFLFTKPTLICISGADFNAKLNKNPIPVNKVVSVKENDVLLFTNKNYGIRTYIAVLGGFESEEKLQSKSFYKGITSSFILRKNDEVFYNPSQEKRRSFVSVRVNKNHFTSKIIECFKGVEFELLSEYQKQLLQKTVFSISNDNSRMGYKLNETIPNNFTSMLTSAVLAGTVQLTPSGKLIILMRDCQVTGGYPRILQVTEVAVNKLAQKSTGDVFRLQIIPS